MKIEECEFGIKYITHDIISDNRGYFVEVFDLSLGMEAKREFLTYSIGNVIRGMHYQLPPTFDRVITVMDGTILDVAVDLRISSPTFGHEFVRVLSKCRDSLFIPHYCAHGFLVLSSDALVKYTANGYYSPSTEYSILATDPLLNINWGVDNPIISDRDKNGLSLQDAIKLGVLFP